jgi:hypothetical protein
MTQHDFQLVVQLPEDCPLESMDFEDDIALALGNPMDNDTAPHFVDGNAYGGGTIEFFVHTNNPNAAFELCKPLLKSAGLLEMAVVAHRRVTDDSFVVIWPPQFTGHFRV